MTAGAQSLPGSVSRSFHIVPPDPKLSERIAAVRYRQLNFDRAAPLYDAVSQVQRQMARHLVGLLAGEEVPQSVLELGCGTGHLSEQLIDRFPLSRFLLTDISAAMLKRSKLRRPRWTEDARIRWRGLDASGSHWDLQERFHLVASNALVQWFPDLEGHFAAVARHLNRGGYYLVSGFLSENLPELSALLAKAGRQPNIGHSLGDVQSASSRAGLELLHIEPGRQCVEYSSARGFFETIRVMGASRYPARRPLSRSALAQLLDEYARRHPSENGVMATWCSWYAMLRKRG